MKNLKRLTLLHSNDMHGDFLAEAENSKLVGGLSLLSGYVQKVRKEEKNVLYAIAGDMFRGSLIDSEYKGISTIEMMNMLGPDVVSLGNHEIDYGLAHLLFVEKCAKFPIINANLYITTNHTRLFKSHLIKEIDGMKIMFIGILTEEVLASTKHDNVISTLVDVGEAAAEVGRICNAYRTEDIDFTILLTHIGIEEDKRLASLLNPEWGVDVIVGGHSHTLLQEPVVINNIPIVQAETGTDQIGRFDIVIDTDHNCIDSYQWKLIPIDNEHCPRDTELESVINRYKNETDQKYGRIITRLSSVFTHPERTQETQLGDLFSDIFAQSLGVDLMLLGSGSIRKEQLGPIVTLQDLLEIYPYEDVLYRITVTGAQLKQMIRHILRDEAWSGHTEFYQFSSGIHITYHKARKELSVTYHEEPIKDDALFHIGLQGFHYSNLQDFLDVSLEEIEANGSPRVLSTSSQDILEEYLSKQELIYPSDGLRLVVIEA